jgi:hypothetical protein
VNVVDVVVVSDGGDATLALELGDNQNAAKQHGSTCRGPRKTTKTNAETGL